MPTQVAEKQWAHEPVLLKEVIHWIRPEGGGTFVDCTLGLGGHAEAMLAASAQTRVIGIDRDREALRLARERLAQFGDRLQTAHSGFENLPAVLSDMKVHEIQGALADLGVSSLQLDSGERGFSFMSDDPLDMRMDRAQDQTAADLVNRLKERELADLIFEYGEERGSRKIARAIIKEREREPITTTERLANIVVRALNIPGRWRIHPATRTFQALRIAVNDELQSLSDFIPAAVSMLARGGRLAIISFHSLEDRIVKRSFQLESGRCLCPSGLSDRTGMQSDKVDTTICDNCGARKRVAVLTRKPIRPPKQEMESNPRARSALLRVCERI